MPIWQAPALFLVECFCFEILGERGRVYHFYPPETVADCLTRCVAGVCGVDLCDVTLKGKVWNLKRKSERMCKSGNGLALVNELIVKGLIHVRYVWSCDACARCKRELLGENEKCFRSMYGDFVLYFVFCFPIL